MLPAVLSVVKCGDIWIYLTVSLLVIVAIYFKSWFRCVRLAFSLPGPPALPLIGNALMVLNSKQLQEIGNNAHQTYGTLFRCWISLIPIFHVHDPKHIQLILGSNKQTNKNFLYSFMLNFLGEGLITNSGQKWKVHRKLIQPCFHINILETYVNTFWKNAEVLAESLPVERDFNITSFVNDAVLDVLYQTVLGIPREKHQLHNQSSPFRNGEVTVPYRITRPWLLLNSLFRFTKQARRDMTQRAKLRVYTRQILHEKRKDLQKGIVSEFKSLLEMLLEISESNAQFTEEDIVDEICTFMLAGQDSVGAAVAFAVQHLAHNQEIQHQAVEELEKVFEAINLNLLGLQDLNRMVYVEQCVKETLRLCPSVPMFARQLSEDVILGKHTLPAGSNVFLSPFATHRLPEMYPEPQRFNPDRFSPENLPKIHPYAYLPFSVGPRNCIGYKFAILEIKAFIAAILKRYEILPVPGKTLNLSYRITIRAKGGIWVRLRKRASNDSKKD